MAYRQLGAACALLLGTFMSGSPGHAAIVQCGQASWYSMGQVTASGARMDASRLAAAHRTLPFGTIVRVENLANGQTVDVVINDRGPFIQGRVIDLTRAAAERIDMINAGVAPVRLTIVHGDAALPGCA